MAGRSSSRRPRRRPPGRRPSSGGSAKSPSAVGEWIRSIAVAGVLFLVIRFFLLQTFVITSGSMEDGLLVNDYLIANRLAFGARLPGSTRHLPGYSHPRRGDVVVFEPHHDVDEKLVKRLVGLPGDTLQMVAGRLVVNGVSQDEPYVKHVDPGGNGFSPEMNWQRDDLVGGIDPESYAPTRDDWGPLVIPDGHYFMLGDNRDLSYDSRFWGPLEEWRVEARVVLIYYSYDADPPMPFAWVRAVRWGRIGDHIG